MTCAKNKPYYIPHNNYGIKLVNSLGTGTDVEIYWYEAFPDVSTYKIAYNIYFSSEEATVFAEGPKYVSTNNAGLVAKISGFDAGDTYYFCVRATEYDPLWYNLNFLADGYALVDGYNLKAYPETLLAADISATDMFIPITDINLFPPYGIIQIGFEYIKYDSKDIPNSTLLVSERGFLGTKITEHLSDGYDGVLLNDPIVKFFTGLEETNKFISPEEVRFNYPNFPYSIVDGYRQITEDLLTTDLTASDANAVNFPTYPFNDWVRGDLDILFKGGCLDSYIGVTTGCADGYGGVGLQVRNNSISDINDQRQELLLSFTGEPVLLMKRLWKGIACSCVEINKQSPEARCPFCFVPGTLVKTEIGWRAIETIKIGEKVLSSDGYYHAVTRVFENQYTGELNSIQPSVSSKPILTTPEHPFLTVRGKHQDQNVKKCGPKCNSYILNGDGNGDQRGHSANKLASGRWWARVQTPEKRKALGTYDTKELAVEAIIKYKQENYELGHHLDWDDASNIEKGDWLVAKWNDEIKDVKSIKIPQEFLKNTKLGEQRLGVNEFELNEEFLWIIGLYIAEGSTGNRTVNFALHRKETIFQNKVVDFFTKLGYNPKMRDTAENGRVVTVQSTTLATWFPKWLGHLCYNKKIPEELMQLSKEKTWALINGIYDGDGSKSFHEIGQTSQILALQLSELLHRVGEQPLIRRQIANTLTPKGNKRAMCYVVSWGEDTLGHVNRKCRWVFKGEILSQVRSVDKKQYSGPVYNLEVEGSHTYVVEGIVVHNCFGTGLVTGYEQYFNPRRSDSKIMVRFGQYTDDVKQEDAGLESIGNMDCWTLTVPTIHNRDIIQRFNIDGTPEFLYEVLNVTRNQLLYGVAGNQHFKAARIRKTEAVYSWKKFNDSSTMPVSIQTTVGLLIGPNKTPIPHTHSLVVSENITALSQINQTTSVSLGHSHEITQGIIQPSPIDGHLHGIIL